MNFQKIKRFVLFVLFCKVIPVASYSAIEKNFTKFEKQLLTNDATIELDLPINTDQKFFCASLKKQELKPWTFIVYMAADNDLRAFAANNIKQMASIGSNENVNIVVHLDIRLNNNQKVTRRYLVLKNKIEHMNHEPQTQKMDSGDPQTLVSFCQWAITHFPAQNYALILWNHGTGIIDPKYYKIINPAELFMFNPTINKFELDRSINYLDLFDYTPLDQRGICFDNTTGNYITNQKLELALGEICSKAIHGKFKLIGFDACLMSMLEISNFIKHYAEVMVGSQEVELGTGWNYAHVLQPLATSAIDNVALATHIVNAYKLSYQLITNDFTQSAINLTQIHLLEQNINIVSKLLIEGLQQSSSVMRNTIRSSRNKKTCTHFDIPGYIDLHHFYSNLYINLEKFKFSSRQNFIEELSKALLDGKNLIEKIVIANVSGKNLSNAKGISIYFPDHVQLSYTSSRFAKENHWATFIQQYTTQ